MGKKSPGLAKFLAGFFAIAIIIALGLIGNMVSQLDRRCRQQFLWHSQADRRDHHRGDRGIDLYRWCPRIGRFAELVVPAMAVLYIIGSAVLLVIFRNDLGEAFGLIFTHAFTPTARRWFCGSNGPTNHPDGGQRGLFSNEAGMGSTHTLTPSPMSSIRLNKGLIAMVGIFIDTIIICSAAALAIVATRATKSKASRVFASRNTPSSSLWTGRGSFLAICLMFFAFTTIIGWYYFGESNVRYLFGKKGHDAYRLLVMAGIVFGALQRSRRHLGLSGFFNSIMVIPNVIALSPSHRLSLASSKLQSADEGRSELKLSVPRTE